MSKQTAPGGTIAELVERMEAHDVEGQAIRDEADRLGLDAARIKSIRKAKADAERTRRTLDALLGAGLVSEGDAQLIGDGQ